MIYKIIQKAADNLPLLRFIPENRFTDYLYSSHPLMAMSALSTLQKA